MEGIRATSTVMAKVVKALQMAVVLAGVVRTNIEWSGAPTVCRRASRPLGHHARVLVSDIATKPGLMLAEATRAWEIRAVKSFMWLRVRPHPGLVGHATTNRLCGISRYQRKPWSSTGAVASNYIMGSVLCTGRLRPCSRSAPRCHPAFCREPGRSVRRRGIP